MSLSNMSAAAVAAWGYVLSGIAAFGALITNTVFGILGRRDLHKIKEGVREVKEHTDGMLKTMVDSAKKEGQKEGHKTGAEQATATAEVRADALAQGQAEGREQGRKPENFRGSEE